MESQEKIGLFGLLLIGVNSIIGTGIWRDSASWVNSAGIYATIALFITWIAFFATALSFGEVISIFPKAGGPYAYAGGTFGEKAGFYVGTLFFIAIVGVTVQLATIIIDLTVSLFTLSPIGQFMLSIILAVVYLLIFGFLITKFKIKRAILFLLFFFIFKLVLLYGFSIFGLLQFNIAYATSTAISSSLSILNGTIWALLGIETLLLFGGITKDAAKTIPKALIYTLLIVFITYSIFTISLSGIIQPGSLVSGTMTIDVLSAHFGIPLTMLVIMMEISAIGTLFVTYLTAYLAIGAMATDKYLPKRVSEFLEGKSSKINLLTYISTLVFTILYYLDYYILRVDLWTLFINNVTTAVDIIMTVILSGIVLIYLRRTGEALERPFKAPAGIIMGIIAIIFGGILLYNLYISSDFIITLINFIETAILLIIVGLMSFWKK